MRSSIFVLRPVQIVDVSFQLLRNKFLSSFCIAFIISIPLQVISWIFEVSISAQSFNDNLTGRTIFIIAVIQCCAIATSLTATSNVLSKRVGRIYSEAIFKNQYELPSSAAKVFIGVIQVGLQLLIGAAILGMRYGLGLILSDSPANVFAFSLLIILIVPWTFATLNLGFNVPIATHEGGTLSQIRKRAKRLNTMAFFRLFGVYMINLLLILLLIVPSLILIQFIIPRSFIESGFSIWALFNIIMAIIVAAISTLYSYILCVTYFNARIEYEGLDISIEIQELEIERSVDGKSFNAF